MVEDTKSHRNISEYLEFRCRNAGASFFLPLARYALDVYLTDKELQDPLLARLLRCFRCRCDGERKSSRTHWAVTSTLYRHTKTSMGSVLLLRPLARCISDSSSRIRRHDLTIALLWPWRQQRIGGCAGPAPGPAIHRQWKRSVVAAYRTI
ncbi:hypothetical protein DFH08DRAFT_324305 [Mycena albidolilacea]|uniref:Uncharacterized protein n=1 Tax=Mycena albidolilacea TaxID=1033008 RepID=A0AAD7ALN3_9AGAR|nr:hypothetical protein DFH08DRAFT_324305 [Mycena albidolilacea]